MKYVVLLAACTAVSWILLAFGLAGSHLALVAYLVFGFLLSLGIPFKDKHGSLWKVVACISIACTGFFWFPAFLGFQLRAQRKRTAVLDPRKEQA